MGVATLDVPAVSYAAGQSIVGTGVIIADPDLRIVHADSAAIDTHGYHIEVWPGSLLTDVVPTGLMRTLDPHYRAALAGEHQSFDYWSDDGSRAYWAQITPIRDPDGTVTRVVAVMQDITERARVLEELSVSEVRCLRTGSSDCEYRLIRRDGAVRPPTTDTEARCWPAR